MRDNEVETSRPEATPPEGVEKDEEILGPPAAKPPSRFRRFLRQALIWAIGLLVVFGLGVLAAYWFLYRPQAQQLSATQAQLEQAGERISELEGEIDRLEPLDTRNQALQADLREAEVRIQILQALNDVRAARLALAMEDAGEAQTILSDTSQTLQSLSNGVSASEHDDVAAMQARLELVMGEIEQDAFAAQSDLEVIEANLLQLEEQYLPQP